MDSSEVEEFWKRARSKAGVAWLEPFVGQQRANTLPPPAFTFSDQRHVAQAMAEEILTGARTALSALRSDYPNDDDLPQESDLAIVLDADEQPVALIRTAEVRICPVEEVDERHAHGEGADSADEWRRQFLESSDATESSEVVLERIVLLYPTKHDAEVHEFA